MVVPAAGCLGAAVDVDRLAGDVAGHVRCEKHCRACHLVDVAGTPHRHDETEPLYGTWGCHLHHPFGHGDVGGQGVDPDAVRGEFEGCGLGVVDDAGLGRRIGCVTWRGADTFD